VKEPMGASTGLEYSSLAWGDYDNDGRLDLAVSGYDGTHKRLIIYHNDGGNNFSMAQEPMGANTGLQDGSLAWGDYDNDGRLDLAVSGSGTAGNRLIIYHNNGGNNFSLAKEPMGVNTGLYYSSLAWGDYDNDGRLDLAVSGTDGTHNRLIIFHNDGGNNFSVAKEPMGASTGLEYSSLAWGDLRQRRPIGLGGERV